MNTFPKEHTQEHAHVRMGQGNHQRGAREAGSGALTSVPGLHHMHSHPCQGLLQHAFLQLCSPLGQKCQCQGWGGGCTLTRGGIKLRPISMASAPGTWDLPGPVRLEQSVSTGLWFLPPPPPPTKVAVASTPWEWMTLPTSAPALPQSLWAHRLHKDASTQGHTPLRTDQETFSPHFIETEKVKQNEKTEEFVSNETIRKTPEKIC